MENLYKPVNIRFNFGTSSYFKKVAYNKSPYYFFIEVFLDKYDNIKKYNIYEATFDNFYFKN